jgi:hypothetical protein
MSKSLESRQRTFRSVRTITLLTWIGVPRATLQQRRGQKRLSFWHRSVNHLDILHQARAHYRKKLLRVHPDKGGSAEKTIALNRAWSCLRRHFKNHGHELHK